MYQVSYFCQKVCTLLDIFVSICSAGLVTICSHCESGCHIDNHSIKFDKLKSPNNPIGPFDSFIGHTYSNRSDSQKENNHYKKTQWSHVLIHEHIKEVLTGMGSNRTHLNKYQQAYYNSHTYKSSTEVSGFSYNPFFIW